MTKSDIIFIIIALYYCTLFYAYVFNGALFTMHISPGMGRREGGDLRILCRGPNKSHPRKLTK